MRPEGGGGGGDCGSNGGSSPGGRHGGGGGGGSSRGRAAAPAAVLLLLLMAAASLVDFADALEGNSAYCTLLALDGTKVAVYKGVYRSCKDKTGGRNCRRRCRKNDLCAMYLLQQAYCDPDNCCVSGSANAEGCRTLAPLTGKPDPVLPVGTLMCDRSGEIRSTSYASAGGGGGTTDLSALEAQIAALRTNLTIVDNKANKAQTDATTALSRSNNGTGGVSLSVIQPLLDATVAQCLNATDVLITNTSEFMGRLTDYADVLTSTRALAVQAWNATRNLAVDGNLAAQVQALIDQQANTTIDISGLQLNITSCWVSGFETARAVVPCPALAV